MYYTCNTNQVNYFVIQLNSRRDGYCRKLDQMQDLIE